MNRPIYILLVEDNPGDADLTREALEASGLDLEIAVVPDGPEALAYLHRAPPHADVPRPDLILLDLNLPKMDGREVLGKIKSEPSLRRIPILILTSSDAERDVLESYDLGANSYVTKPVGLGAFQTVLRTLEAFWFATAKLP